MFRARFKREIVAEFLPPARNAKKEKVVIVCDGMPSIPRKQLLVEFLSSKSYWAFYPRYRGAWESSGQFLEKSPHEDILDILDELPRGFRELAFGERFSVTPNETFVIGGSFGGAAAILTSLDPRVTRVVANCPVVDWSILDKEEKLETSNSNYAAYIREAFGNGYRLSDKNWGKLRGGRFYNPVFHSGAMSGGKIMIIHAQDDPYVPYALSKQFAERTGATFKSVRRGGHMKTENVVRRYWPEIKEFFDNWKKSSDG